MLPLFPITPVHHPLTIWQVVNGAQSFYKKAFGIGSDSEKDAWLLGLVNSAPYLCCALVSDPPCYQAV
jgi:hypothetical protein